MRRSQGDSEETPSARSYRWPFLVHIATLVLGLLLLLRVDRRLWFTGDEWDYLALRGLHHPALSIWQPHNEHWQTLVILLWRLLYTIFGLRTYTPYLLAALLTHVVLAHLIWRRCVRERLDPWCSTAVVALFVVNGAGAENLSWAFQLGFIGAVMFGYLALAVLDSPKSSLWRDLAAGACLLGALMCSAVGDSALVLVGSVVIYSRGWRRSLAVLLLPLVAYSTWYLLVGRQAVSQDHITATTLSDAPSYIWTGLSSTLGSTAGFPSAGPALLLGLLVWAVLRMPTLLPKRPALLATALGSVVFFFLAALGRLQLGDSEAASSRYVYVAFAFLAPLVVACVSSPRPKTVGRNVLLGMLALFLLASSGSLLRSFASSRTSAVLADKSSLLATATVLSQGAQSLTATPLALDSNLNPSELVRLVRQRDLPRVPVSASMRRSVEESIGLAFAPAPLRLPGFALLGLSQATRTTTEAGCSSITAAGSAAQVEIRPGPRGSSAQIIASAGTSMTLFITSRDGSGASPGAAKVVSASPTYLLDLDATDDLTISLPSVGSVVFCGLH